MKRVILIVVIVVFIVAAGVFSGVFNENFGLIRGLRARHLLQTTPEMLKGFKEIGPPTDKKISEIESEYEKTRANLEKIRDDARNDFFDLPKKTRDSSEQGLNLKRIYLDAVYEIVILEYKKNLEIAKLQEERYTKAKQVRLSNI